MAAIGIVLAWAGYSIFYYGLNTVTGGNESLRSLIWPGAYQPVGRDGGGVSDAQRQSDLNQAVLPSIGPTGQVIPPSAPSAPGSSFNPNPPPAPYGGLPAGLGGPVSPGTSIG